MPIQPKPSADTCNPCVPSFRVFMEFMMGFDDSDGKTLQGYRRREYLLDVERPLFDPRATCLLGPSWVLWIESDRIVHRYP